MSAALLNAARHIKLRLPALLHKDAKVKYLTTFDRFGKHVDCPQRRAYELVQNGVDQWRVQAKIQDDVSAQLEATPVETGFDVSFKGEKLGGVYVVDKMLILVNNKTQLPLAAFMHGYTQKEDTLTTGGQFGDGAKVVLAAFARDKHEAGYYTGSECLTFEIRNDPDMQAPTLTLIRTPLANPVQDLVTYAYMGDLDIKGFLSSNFLLFGTKYMVKARTDVGRILHHPKGPQLTLHGICFSSAKRCVTGKFWEDTTFDLTIPTKMAVLEYQLGRDRMLDDVRIQCMAAMMVRKALLEDDVFFRAAFDASIQPIIDKWEASKTPTLRLTDASGVWELVQKVYSSQAPYASAREWALVRQVASKLYKATLAALKCDFLLLESQCYGSQYKGLGSILGAERVVVLEYCPASTLMHYASGTHTQQQVALKVQESIKQKKDSDYEDDVLFLHVKEIVKSIKSSLVVIPVDMGVYANLPLLNLQGNLFVDIERLRIYHTPHCKAKDPSCMICVSTVVLQVLRQDVTGSTILTEDMMLAELAKRIGGGSANRGEKRKEISQAPPAAKKTKTATTTITSDGKVVTKGGASVAVAGAGGVAVAGKGGMAVAGPGGVAIAGVVAGAASGGMTRVKPTANFNWSKIAGDVKVGDRELQRALKNLSGSGGSEPKKVVQGSVARDGTDNSHVSCHQNFAMELFDSVNQLYVPVGFDEVFDMADVGSFRALIDEVKAKIATKITPVPEIRLFYADTWDVVGFYQRPVIYVNFAAYLNCPPAFYDIFRNRREWFKTILHEMAHVAEEQHNARFAEIVHDTTMLFVDM